jgi:P27 family predicted phage terminase small subunit
MKRGPVPAPKKLKILRGSRSDRLPAGAPPRGNPLPDPPFPLDGLARQTWRDFGPELAAEGRLTPGDALEFALLCDAVSRHRQARDTLAEYGLTMKTGAGGLKPNAAHTILRETIQTIIRLCGEFGLSPSARLRLGICLDAPADALDEFLARTKPRKRDE